MRVTRKGYYTIEGPEGLLLRPDGKVRQVTNRDECYEYCVESGPGIYTIKCPDREVEVPLVIGGPYKGGFFGGTNVDISATGTLTDSPQTVPDPDIIVRADGVGTPYTTIQAAISASAAGEIIEIQANTQQGGTQTFDEYLTFTSNASAGNERQLRVRDGDRVNVYPTATQSSAILGFNNATYWVIDGSVGELYIGNRSQWNDTNGGSWSYPHDHVLEMDNSSYVEFKGRSGQNLNFSGSKSWRAVEIRNNCHHLAFRFCDYYGHGFVKAISDNSSYYGDGFLNSGNNVIVEDCNFDGAFGGHNGACFYGYECVVRRNSFVRDWWNYTDQDTTGGYRAFAIYPEDSDGAGGTSLHSSVPPWGPALFEDNWVQYCGNELIGTGSDSNYKTGLKRLKFRYNYLIDQRGNGCDKAETAIGFSGGSVDINNSTEFYRNYNNTYYEHINWLYLNAGVVSNNFQELWYSNNILGNVTTDDNPITDGWPHYLVFARNWQRLGAQGYSDYWLGAKFDGNMIDSDGYLIRLQATGETGDGTATSLANAISTWPNTWLSTNNTQVATFVNAAARTKAGFALSGGSNGEGDAEESATVTAGVTSATISLDDCYWIYDGYDLVGYFGEQPDYIAIYNSDGVSNERIRQVSSVNSKTSVTLQSSVTVAVGDKVFPVLSDGTTVVRNKGAAQ